MHRNKTVTEKKYFMNPQVEWTGGGMASTTEDLAKWAKIYYEGKLVSKTSLNESFHLKMTKSDDDWNPTTFGFDLEELKDVEEALNNIS